MNKLNSLKDIRVDRDYTQIEVAKMLNCNRSTYSDWENGDIMISLDRLDELSMLYNVRISCLLGLERNSKINYKLKKLDYNVLLDNLNKLRKENNHTIKELADYLNCSVSTCYRYFNGTLKLNVKKLLILKELYNVDLDKLCGKE